MKVIFFCKNSPFAFGAVLAWYSPAVNTQKNCLISGIQLSDFIYTEQHLIEKLKITKLSIFFLSFFQNIYAENAVQLFCYE